MTWYRVLVRNFGAIMQEAKTYRAYAADCRRLAKIMSQKDGTILLNMAQAWESRAEEAERRQTTKTDSKKE